MRYFAVIILFAAIAFSCVKPVSKDPVPLVEFKDFTNARKTAIGDTAVLIIKYEDGDGDLFVDNFSQDPNLIFTTYTHNPATGKLEAFYSPIISDTLRYSTKIKLPSANYKGKAVRGEIWVPLREFRPNSSAKIIAFRGYMVDLRKNKSKIFFSPTYTLDF